MSEAKPKLTPRELGFRIGGIVVSALLAIGANHVMTIHLIYEAVAYGFLCFLGLPFLVGALVTFIASKGGPITFSTAVGLGVLSLLGLAAGMLVTGAEGLVCLAMAFPLALPALMLGVWATLKSLNRRMPLGIVFIPLGAAAVADSIRPGEQIAEVRTSLDIDAPPARVWEEIVALDRLPEPTDPFLRTGVACPVRTEIRGSGVGAERHCTLTTGAMPERITVWEPSRRLTFVALETPPMMKEINPFRETHPPHLQGYYRVLQGEFTLEPLPNGRTRLWRVTRYAHRFGPAFYWTPWCDFGADRAHLYVLGAVKEYSEANRVTSRL